MTISNGYITRTNFLNWLASPTAVSAADDLVIDDIIEQVSRFIDDSTGRRFYPFRKTRKYDIPDDGVLYLEDDLSEVYTLTNGDATVIADTDYILESVNDPPYWAVKLRDVSDVEWEVDSDGSSEQIIELDGLWSYRPNYSVDGWTQVGTIAAALNIGDLTFNMTAGHTAVTGQIWKVDNEIFQGAIVTNAVTVIKRGDNGTTAATHLINAPVYMWNTYKVVQNAAYQIAVSIYKKRFGENMSAVAKVTGAGVVITPQDIPSMTQRIINNLARLS